MPRLQAVVQPLAVKIQQKWPIPQVERKVIALLPQFFMIFSPLSLSKSHQPAKHTNADNTTKIEGVARSQTRTTSCKQGISYCLARYYHYL